MRLFNTLGGAPEELVPIEPGHVRMYCCGPTVYDQVHIGNWRAFLFADVLRRTLKARGLKVTQVMNLTDVDDRIVAGCAKTGTSLDGFTGPHKHAFFEGLALLGAERAEHYPEASRHIPEMVDLVLRLRARGHTYDADGSVYYRIASFPAYGRLSGTSAEGLQAGGGGRVDADAYTKENVRDFALWKAWTPPDGEVFWETPLGKGRPGWHLECSAMSMRYLGEGFDLHTGGVDLCFPHHENEIAQSEGATGRRFVGIWMHNAHLSMDGQKMSKSLGNVVRLPDLIARGADPLAVRLALISTHYRQPAKFTDESLAGAGASLQRLREFARRMRRLEGAATGAAQAPLQGATEGFDAALDDDLNASAALGVVFDMVRLVNRLADAGEIGRADGEAALAVLGRFDRILGLALARETPGVPLPSEVERLLAERAQARAARDFARADDIRKTLVARGVLLEDVPGGGVRWRLASQPPPAGDAR